MHDIALHDDAGDAPRLPAIFDTDGWQRPATDEQLRATVATLVALIEPTAEVSRIRAIREAIRQRRYTSAELTLIAKEVPFREVYGKRGVIYLDVVNKVVEESREARRALDPKRSLTEEEMQKVLALPDVDQGHFHISGYTKKGNRPLYRYAPHLGTAPLAPMPMLEEHQPPKRLRDGTTGTFSMNDLGDLTRRPEPPTSDDDPF